MYFYVFILLLAIVTGSTSQAVERVGETSNGNAIQALTPNNPSLSHSNLPPISTSSDERGSNSNNAEVNVDLSNESLADTVLTSSALANASFLVNLPFADDSATSIATIAANIGKILSQIPKCFTNCANEISHSLASNSCSKMMDFRCDCSKPQFVEKTIDCAALSHSSECAGLSKNPNLTQQVNDIYINLCKAASASNSSHDQNAAKDPSPFFPNKSNERHSLYQIILTIVLTAGLSTCAMLFS